MATPRESNRDIVQRMNDEVWGEGNLELIEQLVSDDYVEYNTASPEPIRGPDGYRENVRMVRTAFPDMDVITRDVVAGSDRVAYRYTIVGTHEGPILGVEPTRSSVEIEGMGIARIEDGQLVESWSNVDAFGMMQQLGLVEAPGGAVR